MPLKHYRKKRKFTKTPEPKGKVTRNQSEDLIFVVHEHHASRLHFDLRLELDGVLKSWAVPKGPSLIPAEKRLAVQVEDHPKEYANFAGTIPEGNYGAGEVYIWDKGTYRPTTLAKEKKMAEKVLREGLKKGHLNFRLAGKKLKGEYDLIQIKKDPKNWLLIKKTNEEVQNGKKSAVKNLPPVRLHSRIRPMLATLVDKAFDSKDWIFEIKWDGYRAIAIIDREKVRLYSRNWLSFNEYFPLLIKDLSRIKGTMVLDGEVVVVDDEGKADFEFLQNYKKSGEGNLFYYVFDILEDKGKDLRELPLVERKQWLRSILPKLAMVKYSDHIEENGRQLFEKTKNKGIEGIIAKKADSPYLEGKRSNFWLKIKNLNIQEAIICGITSPRGTRKSLGALVLGVFEKNQLVYVGHTGGGFDEKKLMETYNVLRPLFTKKSPFKNAPETNAPVQWVKPQIVCEVRFANWTKDGLMRVPIFQGIRVDKSPQEVGRENPLHINKMPPSEKGSSRGGFTNLDKIFWPKEGYTKGDLIEYYDKVAGFILPYLKKRAQVLHRFPNGIEAKSFYQKDIGNLKNLKSIKIFSESEGKYINYALCEGKEDLLYLANLACIEMNPWNSGIEKLNFPDYLILDLDPLDISFEAVIKTAKTAKQVLDKAGLTCFCKTSGATGLHIYIPLGAKYHQDQVLQFARILAVIIHQQIPEITSVERLPANRRKKVYLDFLQNREGQTVVAPYSIRPRPGATVSTPLKWQEIKKGLDPKKFTIKTILPRLKKYGDLWEGVLGKGINMESALKSLQNNYLN